MSGERTMRPGPPPGIWHGLGTAAWVCVALLCLSFRAGASQESELLTTRGLVGFHFGRYVEALALFDQAVEADPSDVYARYYQGVTLARLERYEEAVTALRSVLDIKPDLTQGALELGIALVRVGDYGDAIRWLEQAQQVPQLEARASFYLGIAQLRTGRLDEAEQSFDRAAKSPDLSVSARYYRGVAAYRAGNQEKAATLFEGVVAESPDSAVGQEAQTFLTRMREGEVLSVRPYTLYGGVGFEYDSNVRLAPEDDTGLDFPDQADGRAIITVGGNYALWRTTKAQLSVGYDFFQSLHFQLTEFNLQDHRPGAQLLVNVGIVQLGLLGRYDYYLRETTSFLQEATGLPWVTVNEGSFGRTTAFFRFRYRDFKEGSFEVYDAVNYIPGIDQFIYLGAPTRFLLVGYQFDRRDSTVSIGDQFNYDGNRVVTGIGWDLPYEIGSELQYSYQHRDYDAASRDLSGQIRRDDEHRVIVIGDRPLNEYLTISLAYLGVFNQSNQTLYEYDRNIVSLSLGARF